MTFKFNSVYSVGSNLLYVLDSNKVVPEEKNLFTVIEYVDGSHAALLYGKAHGTSVNPKLAAEEFMADRNKYFELHNMREGQKLKGQGKNSKGKSKKEVLAHHIYLSASERDGDKVTPEILNEIMDRFLKAMKWDDHRVVQAPHLNSSRYKHIHASICAYNRRGQAKIHMKNATIYRAKIELNYICVDYGLSIIDDKKVYAWASSHMPEYCTWFDDIKKNKTVEIIQNTSLEVKKQRAEERKAMRKVKADPPKDIQEEIERIITYNHSKARGYATDYSAGGHFINPRKQRPYRMNLYDHNGRPRNTLELLLLLICAILIDTNRYAKENYNISFSQHSAELQKMLDGIAVARKYGVTSPADIQNKLAECGKRIGSCKKAIARLEQELEKGQDARLQKELEKHQENLRRFQKDYGSLARLKNPIREIVSGKYNYRTEIFEQKEKAERTEDMQREKQSCERKAELNELIAKAEGQKRAYTYDSRDVKKICER